MAFEFKLPDIGEGVVEGEIVKWLVRKGDQVKEDEPLVEVMTDKATIVIPSPRRGKVVKTRGQEGEIIKVGETLVVIEEEAQEGKKEAMEPQRVRKEHPAAAERSQPLPAGKAPKEGERILATPATRKLARELGVDLSQVSGTGPGGRVTPDDIRQYVAESATPLKAASAVHQERVAETPAVGAPPAAVREKEERVPFRGVRRRIAEKMVRSKTKAPHFTYIEEADVTDLVALRAQLEEAVREQGVKITYLAFIVRAVAKALRQYSFLNATLDEERGEIVLKKYYNIGIAVSTPQGLMVPVIKAADRKSVVELAREIERLARQAREGSIQLEDLRDGTFTITSLGALGGIFATPIINYPEVAILGVHRISTRPVVRDGQIVPREVMYLSLSFDHRVVDGVVGAEFARTVIQYLEKPSLFFLENL
ncbi:MAG: 2-oxo acid dehydrogenase subunit E2 [Acidobacteria bacterium]|nr:2-oxo acid dehydrogenase subunit E2 [Acidobacteriota bacterium]